jgi:hypothetical protein
MPADPSHRKLRTIGYFCCAGIAYSAISYPTLLHGTPRHSHSIVPNDGRELIFQRKFFSVRERTVSSIRQKFPLLI